MIGGEDGSRRQGGDDLPAGEVKEGLPAARDLEGLHRDDSIVAIAAVNTAVSWFALEF